MIEVDYKRACKTSKRDGPSGLVQDWNKHSLAMFFMQARVEGEAGLLALAKTGVDQAEIRQLKVILWVTTSSITAFCAGLAIAIFFC